MQEEFNLDQEFEIVELEPRRATSPDAQFGSGGSGGGSGGSGGSGGGSGGSGGGATIIGTIIPSGGGSGGGSGGSGGGSGT